MLKTLISWLGGLIVAGIAMFLGYRWAFRAGKETTRASKAEQINDAAQKALAVRDRLRRDSEYARRVRDRFTR